MKEIKLTQNKVALIDDEDFERINQYKWYAQKQKNNFYARRWIRVGKYKQLAIRMHREIINAPKGSDVDHIDHNGLNNQRSNLRVCSRSQNLMNLNLNNGYKCVYLLSSGRYKCQIHYNKINYYYGTYDTPEEAALVYNKKAKELFGEFANLNVIIKDKIKTERHN
jgi:hypothetical protein